MGRATSGLAEDNRLLASLRGREMGSGHDDGELTCIWSLGARLLILTLSELSREGELLFGLSIIIVAHSLSSRGELQQPIDRIDGSSTRRCERASLTVACWLASTRLRACLRACVEPILD